MGAYSVRPSDQTTINQPPKEKGWVKFIST
nr:MAG TPA: hypothetical protein [Caudoviricetes sp.]